MDLKLSRKETKREKFVRLATSRTNNVLKDLDVLSNCANIYSYDYDENDVKKIISSIDKKLKEVKQEFDTQLAKNKSRSQFKLE